MKRKLLLMLALSALMSCAVTSELEKNFAAPPDSARAQTWWHWMNGNVSREGITADLEAMKHVGLGGAQIFNVSEGIPDGPAPFMSPQWLELFKHAASEAQRLKLELCFHNCAGWSSSGGPWIQPAQAMQRVVVSETHAKGPARFDGALRQPETRRNFYRDIAVLAFPTPGNNAVRTADIRAKAGFESRYGQVPQPIELPAEAAIARDGVVNLTDKMAADGRIAWDVPAGDWTILRFGHTLTGATCSPAPVAGRGLECDKLSAEALDAHWAGGIDPILKKLGPLAGRSVNNCLIDSYEVGCNNWTPKLREEFQRRRGYDLMPFLPALTGRIVGDSETTERFLWDFRRVLGDLFAENYYMHFSELCRKYGLKSSMEPYDGPFECLQVGAKADILMGEFWVGGSEPSSVKLAAAAAHTHGIGIVGAESFTAAPDQGKWQNHPGKLKALGDLIWCAGVNRFIIHRYAHQPWLDKFPGMTMGQWGTHFERTTTWWEQSRAWLAYCARSQYLLQQGRFVADVLFFGGEASPNGMVHRPDLKAKGYDYDVFGTDLVPALAVKDGRVTTPAGTSYRLLVLPNTTWMTPPLSRKIRDLVLAGATVLGPKPQKSPGLSGYPGCDAEVAGIADEVWGAGPLPAAGERSVGLGRVIWGRSPEQALAAAGVAPDFEVATAGAEMAFIHRVAGDADFYFVSNQQPKSQTVECLFRIAGRQPELWDPESGRIEPAPIWQAKDGRTSLTLNLDPAGSVFVVFRRPAAADADPVVAIGYEAAIPARIASRPVPKLEIRRAVYGVLSLEHLGMADVTEILAERVKDNGLRVTASNDLAGDPAGGVVKELRVEFESDGKLQTRVVKEGETVELAGTAAGPLRIRRAIYGKFPETVKGLPDVKSVDITAKLSALVRNGTLTAVANNELAGGDPASTVPKELRVEYALDGEVRVVTVAENAELHLPEDAAEAAEAAEAADPAAHLSVENGALRLLAWDAGRYTLTTSLGVKKTVEVPALPATVDLTGPWEVEFHSPVGPQPKATFERLISWPDHPDVGVRYFSGTATYRKTFELPASALRNPRAAILLDLGRVKVIAEVKLNGKDLGILWKTPFRADATGAVRPGKNELEVRVTNLWPNRLIGDEQYPDDCEWDGITIKSWPDWMAKGEPRPSKERVTFTTWKHYGKAAPLLPSGLLGPVTVRVGEAKELRP